MSEQPQWSQEIVREIDLTGDGVAHARSGATGQVRALLDECGAQTTIIEHAVAAMIWWPASEDWTRLTLAGDWRGPGDALH